MNMFSYAVSAATLIVLSSAAGAADYVTTVQSTNPLAYFRLNAVNQSSTVNGFTSSWTNVAITGPGGGAPIAVDPANRGAQFDGVNSGTPGVITTSLSGNISGTGSIAAWVNVAARPSATGTIFYVAGESQFGNDFDLQLDQASRVGFCVGPGQCITYNADTATFLDQWHFITATYDGRGDGTTDFSRIYWDGQLVGNAGGDFTDAGHSSPFTIGYSSVFGGREFNGVIDEVATWGRALSTEEVASIYAARSMAGIDAVPEPATWATMMLGFGMIGFAARRRGLPALAA